MSFTRFSSGDIVPASSLNELQAAIESNQTAIANNATDIATNTADIATNTSAIATNTANIATNTADIAQTAAAIETLTEQINADAMAIDGFEATISSTQVSIAYTSADRLTSGSIVIPGASSTTAGVMTAADYQMLYDTIDAAIREIHDRVDEIAQDAGSQSYTWQYFND